MCETENEKARPAMKTIPVEQAVGTVLAHDITEIRRDEFKGPAFRKGHLVRPEDICHLQRLGKERLFVLDVADDELHENDAAFRMARALMGEGVRIQGDPREGKINIVADRDGLLKVDRGRLLEFNMIGDVMCASLHTNTVVKKDQVVAGTRAIPLIIKKSVVEKAVDAALASGNGVVEVKALRRPRVGIVITGNEVYQGRIKDAFAPVLTKKIEEVQGEIVGLYYAPDDAGMIEDRLRELLAAGADLIITTGGMSVDPDDVTRFAIAAVGATGISYGSAVLPGAMFLAGYIHTARSSSRPGHSEPGMPGSAVIPVLGIPACGMYARTTVFDLILPRILAGEMIGRRELAELGHGGLCLHCDVCRFPVCPFGKG